MGKRSKSGKNKVLRSRFLLLFLALIGLIFISPFFMGGDIARWVLGVTTTLVIVSAIFTMLDNIRHLIFGCLLAAMVVISNFLHIAYDVYIYNLIFGVLALVFYVFAIWILSSQILVGRKITVDTIFEALCLYMLLGVAYANAYYLVEVIHPGSFGFETVGIGGINLFNLIYFSLTTLTTVGYGDMVPLSNYAKSIVMLEEITGVMFLAVLVSRLVAGLTRR